MLKKICDFIARWMGVMVLVVAVVALIWPEWFSGFKPTIINPMLGVVMFGMGLTQRLEDFKIVFSRPRDVITGCLAQFTIMPLMAWLLARLFGLSDELALGVVLVGCCPGGTASNVITYLARGDVALSVGMTGVSTMLAPFLTPLLTWLLAGHRVQVDIVNMFISILWVVILPILLGLLVKRLLPSLTNRVVPFLPAFSSLAIATLVAIVVSANASKLMVGGVLIIVVVMLHNLCGLSLGYLLGSLLRLDHKRRVAISIEVGMQNSGLASGLAALHFAAYPLATVPGALFSVWHNISGSIAARLYARYISKP